MPCLEEEARTSTGTYVEVLFDRLAQRDDEVVADGHRRLTGDQLRALVFQYAHALRELRIGRGDLIALFATSHAHALAVRYAAGLLGAASVLLARPASPQHAELLARTDPRLLVVLPETTAETDSLPGGQVVSIGTVPGIPVRLDDLARNAPTDPVRPEARAAVTGEHGSVVLRNLVVTDDIPVTEQGKPDRAALRRLVADVAVH